MELITQLIDNYDVKESQARGGAGLFLKLAEQKLTEPEFGQLVANFPEAGELMKAAPSTGQGVMGMMGGFASVFGGTLGGLGDLATLSEGFTKLGIDTGAIGGFASTLASYVEERGDPEVRALLAKTMNIESC